MFLEEPGPTAGELRFKLFGFPVRVHPWFWLVAAILGIRSPSLESLLVWVAAMFVGILVHELGHAFAMRAYGFYPTIVLYGFGGLTSYGPSGAFGYAPPAGVRLQISAAGPAAGFALAAALVIGLRALGASIGVVWIGGLFPIFVLQEVIGLRVLTDFLNYLMIICMFWGMINLLPVFPLDGGQIARDLFTLANPRDGARQALVLSVVVALAVALFGLVTLGSVFLALMFGFLAYNSYQLLQYHQWNRP